MSVKREHLELISQSHTVEQANPHSSKKSKAFLWTIVGLLVLAGAAYAIWNNSFAAIEVATAKVVSVSGSGNDATLEAVGYVVPRVKATVSSQIPGEITEVLVEEGDSVVKGDVIARLDDSVVQQQLNLSNSNLLTTKSRLNEVEAKIDEASRDLERKEALVKDNYLSASILDEARLKLTVLQAQLKTAHNELLSAKESYELKDQELQRFTVTAPFTGVVISKNAQPGEIISPGSESEFTRSGICTIVDMDSLEIEVDVNEAYINRIYSGQPAEARLDAYQDWVIEAEVINFVPSADRQKATVKVRIKINELDAKILPDMGVRVKFFDEDYKNNIEEKPRLIIPAEALHDDNSQTFVWLLEDNTLVKKNILAGEEIRGKVEVKEGLQSNQLIVTSKSSKLKEGVKATSINKLDLNIYG